MGILHCNINVVAQFHPFLNSGIYHAVLMVITLVEVDELLKNKKELY